MTKVAFSLILAGLVGAGAVGVVAVASRGTDMDVEHTAQELAQVKRELAVTRENMAKLQSEMANIRATQAFRAETARSRNGATAPAADAAREDEAASLSYAAAVPAEMKEVVFALIDEERQMREEERRREREAFRERMEERRKEIEEMAQGPYERYNLKVNSMGKILDMDDVQKQQYFELVKRYQDKHNAGMTALREQTAALAQAGQDGEDRRRRGPPQMGEEVRTQFRELNEKTQQQFAVEMEHLLTPLQLAAYDELSDASKNFQNLGPAMAEGDEMARFGGGFFGGDMRGMQPAAPGGQRGGRGGGR